MVTHFKVEVGSGFDVATKAKNLLIEKKLVTSCICKKMPQKSFPVQFRISCSQTCLTMLDVEVGPAVVLASQKMQQQ